MVGEARFVFLVRGVEVTVEGFCWLVDRFDGREEEDCDDEPNGPEVDAIENS